MEPFVARRRPILRAMKNTSDVSAHKMRPVLRWRARRDGAARIILCLPVLFLLVVGGCARQGTISQAAPAGPPAVPVLVSTVEEKPVPVSLQAIGNVEPYSTVSLKPQVSGPLMKVHFREGDDVRKGQLLFSLDPRPFQAALTQAQAQLARDRAVAENNRVQAGRDLELFQQGVVPRQQSDDLAAAATAQEAQVRADEAAVETLKLNLDYCSIYSPIDGRTGSLQVHEGNLVKANDVPVLVVINQIRPVYVNFSIPEQQLPEVRKYQSAGQLHVRAVVPNDNGFSEEGRLSFVDNTVDAQTGTIRLKALFENQRRSLWPGQFVNVELTLAVTPKALVVPSKAISVGQNGNFVYVVNSDGTVESRPVTIGRETQQDTVVLQGLRQGETVVIDGQLRLASGSHVTIKQQAGPAEGPVAP